MHFEDLQETHYLIQGGRSSCKTYLMKLQADKEQLQQENQKLKKQFEEILSKYREIIGGKNDKK